MRKRIPEGPECVEFVQVGDDAKPEGYRVFHGSPFTEDHAAAAIVAQRMNFVRNLPPAPMP